MEDDQQQQMQQHPGLPINQGQPLDTNSLLQMILQQQQQQQQLQSQLISALTNQQQHREIVRADPPPQIKSLPVPKLASPENLRLPQFRAWKTRWEDHVHSQKLHLQPLTAQQAVLRSALDEEWVMLWTSDRFPINGETPTDRIILCFEEYLRKRRNPLLDRQEFFLRDQQPGESADRYYANLRVLDDAGAHELDIRCPSCTYTCTARCSNADCDTDEVPLFPLLQETRLRDRLICGLTDKEVQRKILARQFSAIVNLEAVLSICSAQEQSDAAGIALSRPGGSTIGAVTKSTYKRQQSPNRSMPPPPAKGSSSGGTPCYWCGKYDQHDRNECPALNRRCSHCKIRGHWEKVCRNPNRRTRPRSLSPSRNASPSIAGRSSSVARVPRNNSIRISSTTTNNDRTLLPVKVTSANFEDDIRFLCDTGADADIMSFTMFMDLSQDACFEETFEFGGPKMEAANNSSLRIYGKLSATLRVNGHVYHTEIFIVHDIASPILGKTGCQRLGLIPKNWPHSVISNLPASSVNAITSGTKQYVVKGSTTDTENIKKELMSEFSTVFDDSILKPMQGPPMHISLIEGATPCRRYKAYTVPIHWQKPVKEQLDMMETKGVIEKVPVGESYDWCHPMVVVPKKGTTEPRITVDLTGINQFVRRPAYPTRIPRDVVASIPPNQKYFTTLDSRHGFWQIPLDEESKKLTTFITPWGSYRFCRNVMGLIFAGDEHNRRGDEALDGIVNVKKVVEDILLHDGDFKTHIERVGQVLQRCLDHGITLNSKKFTLAQPEVDYCGFTLSSAGYTPAAHLVSAIRHFPIPTSKTDIRSFMGLVQQFESFSSNLSKLAQPLRSLLPKNAAFVWETPHDNAIRAVLDELASPRVLTHFTPGQPLRLETDAAQSRGLGFALWQQQPDQTWKLLQARSRFVTPTESHYSATEIECLAVTWAVRKCRMFLLGQPFQLIVDHRPLVSIINAKTLDEIENPRLQRLKEKLNLFSIQAVWRAGTKHTVVDVFSRFPVSHPTSQDALDDDDPTKVFAISMSDNADSSVIVPDRSISSIREVASACQSYQKLIRQIANPHPVQQWEEDIQCFHKYKDDLRVSDGLVFYGVRLVVPHKSQPHILQLLHASHQGQERTIRRAKQSVFWPGITNDIRNVVASCNACQEMLPSLPKEPLMSDTVPLYPFQVVAADMFTAAGYEYLVVVDKYSGWPSIVKLGTKSTTQVIVHHLVQFFTDTGIPEIIISDNGPQFSSLEFKQWCLKWDIHHRTSSPHYPQSNGLAESAVKSMKYLLHKTSPKGDCTSEAFRLGLLEIRNTPRTDGYSPAQIILGAPARSLLPLHRSQYCDTRRSSLKNRDAIALSLQEKARSQYNANAHALSNLAVGDIVRVQDSSTRRWNLVAEVMDSVSPRSFLLRTEAGRILRRNRRFLRPFHAALGSDDEVSSEATAGNPRRSSRQRHPPLRHSRVSYRDLRSLSEKGHEVVCSRSIPQSSKEPQSIVAAKKDHSPELNIGTMGSNGQKKSYADAVVSGPRKVQFKLD